jgi:hypothetical protein
MPLTDEGKLELAEETLKAIVREDRWRRTKHGRANLHGWFTPEELRVLAIALEVGHWPTQTSHRGKHEDQPTR